jgi:hypothetical protein
MSLPGDIPMCLNQSIARVTATLCAILSCLWASPAYAAAAEPPSDAAPGIAFALPMAAPIETETASTPPAGPVVIDNDEAQLQAEYKWTEIKDGPNKTHISAGARFPVAVQSQITSKTAKVGDPIEARLKVDLKIGGRLIAPKGTRVIGHVSSVNKARKLIVAEFTPNQRWLRMAGSVGVTFDEIVTDDGQHIPLVAMPARNPRIIKNGATGRVLGVNASGQVASPLSTQLKMQVAHEAIRLGASAAGVFSFGAVPAAYACVGAISPSFAFMQPIGKNVRHRRIKGAAMGLVSGLPGGFLISDSIIRGPEAIIEPGDTFEAEFKQDFTGEASTEADLLPGASIKVHGQVVPVKK